MFYLPLSLNASRPDQFQQRFHNVFKQEIKTINPELLPLQQGLQYSSYALAKNLSISVLNYETDGHYVKIKANLLYTGVIAGCNCADDPTPVEELNECCQVLFSIDKETAATTVTLIEEG